MDIMTNLINYVENLSLPIVIFVYFILFSTVIIIITCLQSLTKKVCISDSTTGVIAGIYALYITLDFITIWDNRIELRNAISSEINALQTLNEISSLLRTEKNKDHLKTFTKEYTQSVISQEWNRSEIDLLNSSNLDTQTVDQPSHLNHKIISQISHTIRLKTDSNSQEELQEFIIETLKGLINTRQSRITAVNTAIPPVEWFTIFIFSCILISCVILSNNDEKKSTQLFSAISFILSLSIVLGTLSAYNNPLRGSFRITPLQYENFLQEKY